MTQTSVTTTVTKKAMDTNSSITSLALSSMFWRPLFLSDSEWLEHIPFAFWLIEALQPSTIVELGTSDGASYFAMCQAVDRLRLDTSCYAVPVSTTAPEDVQGFENGQQSVKRYNEYHFASFSRLIDKNARFAVDRFSDASIDLLHIDGLTEYNEAVRLLDAWLPKLGDSGVLLLHDTNVRESPVRVHDLFEGLATRYPALEFKHGHGLGLLGVGTEQVPLLQRLFATRQTRGGVQALQDVFSRLGKACSDNFKAGENERKLTDLAERLKASQSELATLQNNLATLRQSLDDKVQEVERLSSQIHQQVETQALERGQLVERSHMVQKLYDELKQHANELQRSVDETNVKLGQQQESIVEGSREQASLEARVETLVAQKQQQEKLIEQQHKSIVEGSRQQASLEARVEILVAQKQQQERLIEQRQEEIRSLKESYGKILAEFENQEKNLKGVIAEREKELSKSHSLEQRLQALGERVKVEAEQKRTAQANLEKARRASQSLQDALKRAEKSVEKRFREIAALTGLLEEKENRHRADISTLKRENGNLRADLSHARAQLANSQKGLRERITDRWMARKHCKLIRRSGLFDSEWYLNAYPDVASDAKASERPLLHFVLHGGAERRNPGPDFDTAWYIRTNPDVAADGLNPLVHYLLHGKGEGRPIKPVLEQVV